MAKTFLIWFLVAAGLFGIVGGGLHLYLKGQPERILVAVDSSFTMQPRWPDVMETLENLNAGERYSEFALITEKRPVHGWQSDLNLGGTRVYGPRRLDRLVGQEAPFGLESPDRRLFITSRPEDTEPLRESGWEIVLLSR
ncbi:MAG: hypothetical protein GY703_11310 [Gammaproteobacteria bacterium]|nr:hypothetical protein [Gammaproteobacteria bacterium]